MIAVSMRAGAKPPKLHCVIFWFGVAFILHPLQRMRRSLTF
jgi:hypothetical protein